MRPLILASASPRRRQLLALGGWVFAVRAVSADETPQPGEPAEAFVRRLSETKARLAMEMEVGGERREEGTCPPLIVACDTTVVLEGQLLNKPADADEARRMLAQLRGRTHEVLTAVTVLDSATGAVVTDVARSRVPMRRYSQAEIEAYVASGDPLDKAGAYAIQHPSFQPVDRDRFGDCFANVMGLPLCHLLRRLRTLGVESPTDLPAECQAFIPYRCPVYAGILNGEEHDGSDA